MLPGLRESVCGVARIVGEQAEVVGIGNVILGGISQGCATALLALLVGG